MVRPPGRLVGDNQCHACRVTFTPETQVILARGGSVICAEHRGLLVPEAVFAEGPWSDIKRRRQRG